MDDFTERVKIAKALLTESANESLKEWGGKCVGKIKVVFPYSCKDKPGDPCPDLIPEIEKYIANNFNGFTSWKGEGCWMEGERKVCDFVEIIEAGAKDACYTDKALIDLAEKVDEWGKSGKQTTVYLEVNDQAGYVIAPERREIIGKKFDPGTLLQKTLGEALETK